MFKEYKVQDSSDTIYEVKDENKMAQWKEMSYNKYGTREDELERDFDEESYDDEKCDKIRAELERIAQELISKTMN